MPFFHRSCNAHRSVTCPQCEAQDSGHRTVQRLKATQPHHPALTTTTTTRTPTPTRVGSAVVCTMGLAALAGAALYASRTPRAPQGIAPVDHFDVDRYLGKWYELARIDHRFESDLQRTQAEYSRNANGSIQVTNRGYHAKHRAWKISHGIAKLTSAPNVAALKVSFFGPFYGGYNVVALDVDYQWAMVVGSSLDYFWILSRKPALPGGVKERLMRQARMLGIQTHKILWVYQDGVNPTGN